MNQIPEIGFGSRFNQTTYFILDIFIVYSLYIVCIDFFMPYKQLTLPLKLRIFTAKVIEVNR